MKSEHTGKEWPPNFTKIFISRFMGITKSYRNYEIDIVKSGLKMQKFYDAEYMEEF